MALNFTRIYSGVNLVPKVTSTVNGAGDLDFDTTNARLNLHNGISASPVLTISHTAQGAFRVQNKDLEADTTAIVDATDTTKKVLWNAAPATTGTSTTLRFAQTANRIITFPDNSVTLVGANDPAAGYVLRSGDTMTGTLNIGTGNLNVTLGNFTVSAGTITGNAATLTNVTLTNASNQLVLSSGVNQLTINSGTSAAARTYTVPDAGVTASFVMTESAQTINGAKTLTSALTITPVSNQLVLGTTNTVTLNAAAPVASRTYTIPDTGVNSSFIMSDSNQTKNGNLTLTNKLSLNQAVDTTTTGTDAALSAFTTSYVELTNSGLISLSSIPAGINGQYLVISNKTGADITLRNLIGPATQRINTGIGADLTLTSTAALPLIYDANLSQWQLLNLVTGGSGSIFYGCKAYQTTTTLIGSPDYIKLDTIDYDSATIYDTVTGYITIPITGKYLLTVKLGLNRSPSSPPANGANGFLTLYSDPAGAANQIEYFGGGASQNGTGSFFDCWGTTVISATIGEVYAFNVNGSNSTDSVNGLNGNFKYSHLEVTKIG